MRNRAGRHFPASAHSYDPVGLGRAQNGASDSLARELRKELMGQRAFLPFAEKDFGNACRIFWGN